MSGQIGAIAAWRDAQRASAAFLCTPQPLSRLDAWTIAPDAIRHASGGFFQVVAAGCRSNLPALDGLAQPFILQPEIGILGFLASPSTDPRRRTPRLLVQAKTEPGNIGAVQLAPSFQCTPSNYTGRHGGPSAPFLALFAASPPAARRSDLVHSEQGTRFLGKFNRNMMVEYPADSPAIPDGGAWRWIDAAALLPLLAHDNLVNTDARSVLAGTPWTWLCGGAPFARWRGGDGFGAALDASHGAGDIGTDHRLAGVLAWLAARRRAARLVHDRIALAALDGWTLDGEAWRPDRPGGFAVRGYAVQARDREVQAWHQPLVDSPGTGRITLLCQRRRGLLHVMLHGCAEPGLANIVEFGTTLQIPPGTAVPGDPATTTLAALADTAAIHLRCRQSEEGGRFHCDENDYTVAELPEAAAIPPSPDHIWVGIAQLAALCARPGLTTNELRSATALLLSLAA